MDTETVNKRALPLVFFTVFLDLLGYGILIPIIPILLADPLSSFYILPKGVPIATGYILLGLLIAVFPLMQFLSTPILGQLSDRYGRKKLLALSLAGTSLSYVLFAIAILTKNIPLLFISRALDGMTGGNIAIAQAIIADVTPPEKRARNFGLIGAAFGLGFIIGPYIGGKLSDPHTLSWFNAATPFWFAAILALINTMLVLFILPETLKHVHSGLRLEWNRSVKNIFTAFSVPNLRSLFITGFLFISGFTFFTTFFSVFLINKFSFHQGNIGDFFAYVGLWIAITQLFLIRRLTKWFKEEDIIRFSLFVHGIMIFMYFLPNAGWQLLLVAPFFSISNGLVHANLTALVSKSATSSTQGRILGINASVQAFAQTIPPVLSGFIAAWLAPEFPLVVAGVLILLAGIYFWWFYRRSKINSLNKEKVDGVTCTKDLDCD